MKKNNASTPPFRNSGRFYKRSDKSKGKSETLSKFYKNGIQFHNCKEYQIKIEV